MKSADERIDSLEKSLKLYRILTILLVVLLFVVQRYTVVGWIDSVEGWIRGGGG